MTIVALKPDLGREAPQVLPDDQSSLLPDPWSDGWSLPSPEELQAMGYPGARPQEALQPRHNGNVVTLEEHRQTVEAIRALYGDTAGIGLKRRANGTTATAPTDDSTPATDRALAVGTTTTIGLPGVTEIEPQQTAEAVTVAPDAPRAEPDPLPDSGSKAEDSTPRAAIEADDPFTFLKPPSGTHRSR